MSRLRQALVLVVALGTLLATRRRTDLQPVRSARAEAPRSRRTAVVFRTRSPTEAQFARVLAYAADAAAGSVVHGFHLLVDASVDDEVARIARRVANASSIIVDRIDETQVRRAVGHVIERVPMPQSHHSRASRDPTRHNPLLRWYFVEPLWIWLERHPRYTHVWALEDDVAWSGANINDLFAYYDRVAPDADVVTASARHVAAPSWVRCCRACDMGNVMRLPPQEWRNACSPVFCDMIRPTGAFATRLHAQRLSARFLGAMASLARREDAIAVSELSVVSAARALQWPEVHEMIDATAAQYFRHDVHIAADEWAGIVEHDRRRNSPRLYHALKF